MGETDFAIKASVRHLRNATSHKAMKPLGRSQRRWRVANTLFSCAWLPVQLGRLQSFARGWQGVAGLLLKCSEAHWVGNGCAMCGNALSK